MARKSTLLLAISLGISLLLTSCNSPPPASGNLCVEIHPIGGWSAPELQGLTTDHLRQIKEQNCKIQKACNLPVDRGCQ